MKVKIGDNFLEIILNRPEKKNALNHLMIRELGICTDYANATKKIRVVMDKKNILLADETLDITKDIMSLLNKKLKSINLN